MRDGKAVDITNAPEGDAMNAGVFAGEWVVLMIWRKGKLLSVINLSPEEAVDAASCLREKAKVVSASRKFVEKRDGA